VTFPLRIANILYSVNWMSVKRKLFISDWNRVSLQDLRIARLQGGPSGSISPPNTQNQPIQNNDDYRWKATLFRSEPTDNQFF